MRNTAKVYRVFIDTSSLLSGLNSPFGASGFIISLFKLKRIIIVISPEVIIETEIAIKNKFPLLKIPYLDFYTGKPVITEKASKRELQLAYKIINTSDTPILAGAVNAKADFLITLDKKFQKLVKDKASINIVTPGEFLKIYRGG